MKRDSPPALRDKEPSCDSSSARQGGAAPSEESPVGLRFVGKLRGWLQHRHLPWHLALLAMLLCAPSLWMGWHFDDDFHRAALTMPEFPALSRSPAELFVFIEGDEVANRWAMKMGMLPWWSNEELRLAFFRPLTGLTHWVDHKLWPRFPSLMHLHSLVWLGGVVVAASFFYRRVFPSAWVAGLAALLFAVDDAHGVPAAWLANRNALIGVFFGLLTLIAHHRWRRDGWRTGAVLAPLAFLLGLLSKESTLAIGAYLTAYAIFLDRGTRVGRLCTLAPCTLIGVIWWAIYKALGYGAVGSGWYIDPVADPAQFAQAVVARAPLLLGWQWLVPSDLQWELSQRAAHVMWLATLGFLVIIAVLLAPLVRRDRVARFWTLGMVLSVLPACAAYPADRLLFFVGIGGMGLLAQLVASVVRKVDGPPMSVWRRLPERAICGVLAIVHLAMASVALARTAGYFKRYSSVITRVAHSLPSESASRLQTVLIVNTPTYALITYSTLIRLMYGEPYLCRTLVLGSGSHPTEISRPDERTLLVRPEGGYLAPAGGQQPGQEAERLLFDQWRAFQAFDRLYRDSSPMRIGRRVNLIGVTAEIIAITDDGRPAEVAFRFAMRLENRLFRWMQWKDGAYVPFALPAVGETVTLPAATVPF